MRTIKINKDILAMLGAISVNFQVLETEMKFLAWNLIGQEQEVGQIITAQLGMKQICNLVGNLFRYKTRDTFMIKELDNIIKRVDSATEKRNTLTHSNWLATDESKPSISRFKITAKTSKGLEYQYKYEEATDLKKVARSIQDVADELMTFIGKAKEKGIINFSSYQIRTPPT